MCSVLGTGAWRSLRQDLLHTETQRGEDRIMTGRSGSRLVVLVSMLAVMLFAASVAVGASPSAVDKSSAVASPQAVVVGPVAVTPVVYVATGSDFPDALGASPVAGITDGPILLVQKTVIPTETATELIRWTPDRIVIIGGTGVVSDAVETALGAYARTVERLSGLNRYATAAAVSAASFPAAHPFVVYDTSDETTQVGAACTDYDGLILPITVPGPGTIVVESIVSVQFYHTNSQLGFADLYIGTSPTDCTDDIGLGADYVFHYVDSNLPTGQHYAWPAMRKILHVDSAGTHTFYVTGRDTGTDSVYFRNAYMDATFIPDPGT